MFNKIIVSICVLAGIAVAQNSNNVLNIPGITRQNDTSTGTTQYRFVKIVQTTGYAVVTGGSETVAPVGVASYGAGTSGSVYISTSGIQSVYLDGTAVAGNLVTLASSGAGHDSGATTCPGSGIVVGVVTSPRTGAGVTDVLLTRGACASSASSSHETYLGLGLCEGGNQVKTAIRVTGSGDINCNYVYHGGFGYITFSDSATTTWAVPVPVSMNASLTSFTVKLSTRVGGSPGGNDRYGVATSCVTDGSSWTTNTESLQTVAEGAVASAPIEITFTPATTNCTAPRARMVVLISRYGGDGADSSNESTHLDGVGFSW